MSTTVFVRVLPGNVINDLPEGWTLELPPREANTMVAKGWVELADRPDPPPPPAVPTIAVRLTSETVEGHAGDLVEVDPWRAGWLREIGAAEVVGDA